MKITIKENVDKQNNRVEVYADDTLIAYADRYYDITKTHIIIYETIKEGKGNVIKSIAITGKELHKELTVKGGKIRSVYVNNNLVDNIS